MQLHIYRLCQWTTLLAICNDNQLIVDNTFNYKGKNTTCTQCCCPRGKSWSSRILKDQFTSPCPWTVSPCPWITKSSTLSRTSHSANSQLCMTVGGWTWGHVPPTFCCRSMPMCMAMHSANSQLCMTTWSINLFTAIVPCPRTVSL